jgi:hypothetical protein
MRRLVALAGSFIPFIVLLQTGLLASSQPGNKIAESRSEPFQSTFDSSEDLLTSS